MLSVGLITSYCNFLRDGENRVLHDTLDALERQTHKPVATVLCDDSHPLDQPAVKALCRSHGAIHVSFPFTNYAFAYGRKYNFAAGFLYQHFKPDAFLVLCSSWQLAPNWIEEMARWLEELGPGNIVGTSADYDALPRVEGGEPEDWFPGTPDRWQVCVPAYFDNARFMFHVDDWILFDEDFDPPVGYLGGDKGSMHATVYWIWQQLWRGEKCWLRKDLEQQHGVMPRSDAINEQVTKQVRWSEQVARNKGFPG